MSYFTAKMHQIQFWLGLRPTPRWGSLQHPRPLAGFKGPTSKGREGKGGNGRGGKRRKGREGCPGFKSRKGGNPISNTEMNLELKTELYAGLLWLELSFKQYCREFFTFEI